MRIKIVILMACLGLLSPRFAMAEVESIAFRIGQDGSIQDIYTTLPVTERALITPIVEPDGTLTDPEEEMMQEEEAAAEEESDLLFTPKMLSASATRGVTAVDCTTLGGSWVEFGSVQTCCNSDGHPAKSDGSDFESYVLLPQCGCPGYVTSFNTNENGEWACCSGHKSVATRLDGSGVEISESDDALCACPPTFTYNGETWKVRDKSTTNSLRCCARNRLLQPGGASLEWNDCECQDGYAFDADDQCVATCSATHPEACGNSGDCTTAGGHWCGDQCQEDPCIECPDDAEPVETEDGFVCCEGGYEYIQQETEWVRIFNPSVCNSCPQDGDDTVEVLNGICCNKTTGYAWSEDDEEYNVVDPEHCNVCPVGYSVRTYSDASGLSLTVCCDNNNRGQYYGMGDSDEDVSNGIRACGCPSGAVPKKVKAEDVTSNIPAGYVCCDISDGDYHITDYTKDVLEEISEAQVHGYCGCLNGQYTNEEGVCASCWTNAHCSDALKPYCEINSSGENRCVACTAESCAAESKICTDDGCVSCSGSTPHYKDGVCYECLADSHCAEGKVCDLNNYSCVRCIEDGKEINSNHGCENVTENGVQKPYCVLGTGNTLLCSECRSSQDCKLDAKPYCQLTTGECGRNCGANEYDKETGDCKCPGAKVWDIYHNKCVNCYNSVSGSWTDFGCNKVEQEDKDRSGHTEDNSPYNYSPRQKAKTEFQKQGRRVCSVGLVKDSRGAVTNTSGDGKCVVCAENSHCIGEKECLSDNGEKICKCPTKRPNYDSQTGRCLECTANNGASSGTTCAATKPLCKDGTCTCSANYDSSKKNGDGKCPQATPVCHNGQCKTCAEADSTKPTYDVSQKKCVTCDANSTYNNGKCVCKSGYGVVNGRCVDAKVSSIASNVTTNCNKQACQTRNLFSFTTVNGMRYKLKFDGDLIAGDWAQFTCEGSILPKKSDSTSYIRTKKWCSNISETRDSDPDNDPNNYCRTPEQNTACDGDGQGDGKDCARATKMTRDDDVTFVGDGNKCTFSISNGNGKKCIVACVNSAKKNVTVVPTQTSYTP